MSIRLRESRSAFASGFTPPHRARRNMPRGALPPECRMILKSEWCPQSGATGCDGSELEDMLVDPNMAWSTLKYSMLRQDCLEEKRGPGTSSRPLRSCILPSSS